MPPESTKPVSPPSQAEQEAAAIKTAEARPLGADEALYPPTAAKPSKEDEDTVTIACKMPNGLTLRVYEEFMDREQMQSGQTREIKRFEPTGEVVIIKGNALDIAKLQNQELPDYQISNGYALTTGVSKRFWEIWIKQHYDSPMLRNGLLFAQPTENRARDDAKGRGVVRSGLEPIDPDDPSKTVPSSIASRVQKGDRTAV